MYLDLLRIKTHREQNAGQALRRQQTLTEQQARIVCQTEEKAMEFHASRLEEEQRAFAAIQGHSVKLARVERMNQLVMGLIEQEALLKAKHQEEHNRLVAMQEALAEARRRHLVAVREREKFERFIEQQTLIEQRSLAMKEEQELEESVVVNFLRRQS